jgi:hypothetical protein
MPQVAPRCVLILLYAPSYTTIILGYSRDILPYRNFFIYVIIYISSHYSIYCFVYYILLRILGYSRDILPHRNFLAYRNSLSSHDNADTRDSTMDARSAGLGGSIGSTKAASAVMSPAGSPPPAAGGGKEARLTSDAPGGGSGRPLNAPSVDPLTGTSL